MKVILKQFVNIESEHVKLFGNVMEFNKEGHFKSFTKPHLNSLHKETVRELKKYNNIF